MCRIGIFSEYFLPNVFSHRVDFLFGETGFFPAVNIYFWIFMNWLCPSSLITAFISSIDSNISSL